MLPLLKFGVDMLFWPASGLILASLSEHVLCGGPRRFVWDWKATLRMPRDHQNKTLVKSIGRAGTTPILERTLRECRQMKILHVGCKQLRESLLELLRQYIYIYIFFFFCSCCENVFPRKEFRIPRISFEFGKLLREYLETSPRAPGMVFSLRDRLSHTPVRTYWKFKLNHEVIWSNSYSKHMWTKLSQISDVGNSGETRKRGQNCFKLRSHHRELVQKSYGIQRVWGWGELEQTFLSPRIWGNRCRMLQCCTPATRKDGDSEGVLPKFPITRDQWHSTHNNNNNCTCLLQTRLRDRFV